MMSLMKRLTQLGVYGVGLWGVGLCGLVGILTTPVSAQVRVSPLVVEEQFDRGKAQAVLQITNPSDQDIRARLFSEPFTYGDKGLQVLDSSPQDLGPYLVFTPRELVLPAGQTRRVRLVAQIPPDLPEGEYRAVVFTETLQDATDSEGQLIAIRSRIGINVFMRNGELAADLSIEDAAFDLDDNAVELLIRNQGDASTLVSIDWQLQQDGSTVDTGEIQVATIVTQTDRPVILTDPNEPPPPPGNYQLTGEVITGSQFDPITFPFEFDLQIPEYTLPTAEDADDPTAVEDPLEPELSDEEPAQE